jgi:hypothetical protein
MYMYILANTVPQENVEKILESMQIFLNGRRWWTFRNVHEQGHKMPEFGKPINAMADEVKLVGVARNIYERMRSFISRRAESITTEDEAPICCEACCHDHSMSDAIKKRRD